MTDKDRLKYIKRLIGKDIALTGKCEIAKSELTHLEAMGICKDMGISFMPRSYFEDYIFERNKNDTD